MNDPKKTDFDELQDQDEVEDLQWKKIQNAISEIQPGYTIAVHRMRPSWCKGYLERLEFLDDDRLDLDYLADTWGGEVLRLRFCDQTGTYKRSVDVPFYSYAPKFRGRVLKRNAAEDSEYLDRCRSAPGPMQADRPVQVSPADTLGQMLGLLKQTRSEDLKVFREILNQVPTDPPVVGNTIGNFIEFAHQFKELKGLFGDAERQLSPEGGDQAALFSTIGEIIKAMTQKSAPPRLIQTVPAAIVQKNPGMAAPVGIPSIAEQMASMDPKKAAGEFIEALGRMDGEKRQNVIESILSGLGVQNDLGLGNDDPEDDEDDDDADQ